MSDPTNDDPDGLRPAAPALLVILLAEALVTSLGPDEARALAISLLAQADSIARASGMAGLAPCRHRGRPVLPRHVHDVFCGWRISTRDEGDPTVGWCAGCSRGVAIGAEEAA